MIDNEVFQKAIDIKKEQDISSPINDVMSCIDEVKKTGVNEENVDNMVISMFNNDRPKKYINKKRDPQEKEILLYDINNNMTDLIKDPR